MALASRQQQQRKESDLFTGASNRFAIGTLAERTIGYVLLVHLQDNDTAEATSAGVARGVMSTFPAGLRHMLTWDQGIELARNNRLADDLGTSMQFCEANFPWQRQTNENTNGLLSDYFPSEPTSHPTPPNGTARDALNNRRCKCLNCETPATIVTLRQKRQSFSRVAKLSEILPPHQKT